jgi:hypothetical protein
MDLAEDSPTEDESWAFFPGLEHIIGQAFGAKKRVVMGNRSVERDGAGFGLKRAFTE